MERRLEMKQFCGSCGGVQAVFFDDEKLTVRCGGCQQIMRTIKTSFDIVLERTLSFEGWWIAAPADPRGETFRGIARLKHPGWLGWAIIVEAKLQPGFPQNLKSNARLQDLVRDFYRDTFWLPAKLDQLIDMEVAAEIFDASVLHGIRLAVLCAQGSLIILNRPVVLDGLIGAQTIGALNGFGNALPLLTTMNGCQFIALVLGSENFDQIVTMARNRKDLLNSFMRGWAKRVSFDAEHGKTAN